MDFVPVISLLKNARSPFVMPVFPGEIRVPEGRIPFFSGSSGHSGESSTDFEEEAVIVTDVYDVRITGHGDPNDIQQVRLTPNSFTLPTSGFLGDYHHMALTGAQPTLYPAYIAMHNDKPNGYVNKISILCLTELSVYAEGEEDARALYEKLCTNGTIDADLNGDDVIDAEDEAVFIEMIAGVKGEND
ncbi:MAG: hypothetical protein FLDDKLPJ_01485 [Phycisphaerae bacterium]|nr:hypothetical protein [Phycisphaerae bacterium]